MQIAIEYDPHPPVDSSSQANAHLGIVELATITELATATYESPRPVLKMGLRYTGACAIQGPALNGVQYHF